MTSSSWRVGKLSSEGAGAGEPEEPPLQEQLHHLLQDYLQRPCIHGVSYLADPKLSCAARWYWRCLLVACVVGLVVVGIASLNDNNEGSTKRMTVTSVVSTALPSHHLPFPSVTVCPLSNIKKSIALDFLRKHSLKEHFTQSEEQFLLEVLVGLQSFRYPWYSLNALPNLERLKYGLVDAFNVTHLMWKVLPSCKEIFGFCFFHGDKFDCCSEFHLQETNMGYCYSFNSCLDMERRRGDCHPKRNVRSGAPPLVVQLLKLNRSEFVSLDPKLGGYIVTTTDPLSIPQPVGGVVIDPDKPRKLNLQVMASGQTVAEDVGVLPVDVRNCQLLEERLPALPVSYKYTETACREACRLQHIAQTCGCLPYHFAVDSRFPMSRYPICNLYNLDCITNNPQLRSLVRDSFYRGPVTSFWQERRSVASERSDCNCPQDCGYLLYIQAEEEEDIPFTHGGNNNTAGTLQVQLKGGGILFQVRLRRSFVQILGNWGNIACLFLGVSLLSAIELIYVCGKGISLLVRRARLRTLWKLKNRILMSNNPDRFQIGRKIVPGSN